MIIFTNIHYIFKIAIRNSSNHSLKRSQMIQLTIKLTFGSAYKSMNIHSLRLSFFPLKHIIHPLSFLLHIFKCHYHIILRTINYLLHLFFLFLLVLLTKLLLNHIKSQLLLFDHPRYQYFILLVKLRIAVINIFLQNLDIMHPQISLFHTLNITSSIVLIV